MMLLLAACKDDGPTAGDITAAYEAQQSADRENLLERYGSREEVPRLDWGFASIRHEVDLTDCEKSSNERGYLCVYDLHFFAMGGDREMDSSPARDVEARVFDVSNGWDVEEIYDDEPQTE